jgi:hypothetical protein
VKRPTLIEWLEKNLEERGAIGKVDREYYVSFLEMSDKEIYQIIRLIIYASAKEINRMAFDEQRRYKDADFFRLIQNALSLMFEGWLCFNDNGLGMVKPDGPEPTPAVKRLLDQRAGNAMPLIRRAFVEVMNRKHRTKK